jgi:hypothetical protein
VAGTAGQDLPGAFGLRPNDLIGRGGQSDVYALDAARILRILRSPAADLAPLRRLQALLAEVDGRLAIPTSAIEEIDERGRYTIERRLSGRSMLDLLPSLSGAAREAAFRNYALGAEAPAAITFADRPYGEVLCEAPIRADDWHGYLGASLERYAAANKDAIAADAGDPAALKTKALRLLAGVPKQPPKALVHGDYFPGNVLLDAAQRLSGLVDFSIWTVVGDRAIDLAGAAIFLEMIAEAGPDDIALVRALLLARHGPHLKAAGPFYRAYFAFAMADPGNYGGLYPKLYPWSIANLKALGEGRLAF